MWDKIETRGTNNNQTIVIGIGNKASFFQKYNLHTHKNRGKDKRVYVNEVGLAR